jgi:hypothetical protein
MKHVLKVVASVAAASLLLACVPREPTAAREAVAPKVTQGSPEATKWLGDLPARARALGAGPLAVVAGGQVEEGGRLGAFVDADQDSCVLFYARASTSVDDLDAAAFSDDGNPIAVDEGPDPRPTLLLCPPHPRRLYLSIHVAQGEGFAALGAQLVPKERAAFVARGTGARGVLGGAPRRPEAWPGLDDRVRAHRALVSNLFEEVRRVAVPLDANAPSRVALPEESEGCVDALVVPDDDVALVDVEAIDDGGRIVARAPESTESERSLTVCSPFALPLSLSLRPHVGRGLAAVVLFRAKGEVVKGEPLWQRNNVTIDKAKSQKNELLKRAGYAPAPKELSGVLRTGQRARIPLTLPESGCSRVDVVFGAPLSLVDATLTDSQGEVLGQSGGASGITTFACANKSADLWLEARGTGGPYAVLVRKEKTDAAELSQEPIASARAFGRMAHGLEVGAGPVQVRALPLAASKISRFELPLNPGECARVAAGIRGDAFGIELHLTDAQDGTELDRAEGEASAMVMGCADKRRTLSFEATVAVGKANAVVMTQTFSKAETPSKAPPSK